MKFKVIADFKAQGVTIPADGKEVNSQPREGIFQAGEEIDGQLVTREVGWPAQRGYNFASQGIFWNMPMNYLQEIGVTETAVEEVIGETGGIKPLKPGEGGISSDSLPSKPILPQGGFSLQSIKNSKLPAYGGGLLGAAIGWKLSDSFEILPKGINGLVLMAAGAIAGYYGVPKLLEKL